MANFRTDDFTNIYYEDAGAGPAMVFLHGWTGNHCAWAPAVRHFTQKGYRVITYDHRGHGASGLPPRGYTMERLARDLEGLMAYLDLKDVILCGLSMGAHVLFAYARLFGCARLSKAITMDMSPKLIADETWPHGLYKGSVTQQDNLDILHAMEADLSGFWRDFFTKVAAADPISPEVTQALVEGVLNFPLHVAKALWIEMVRADYRKTVSAITVPTLILYGDPGSAYGEGDAQALHNAIPHSTLQPIPGGHMFYLAQPKATFDAIENFMIL